MDNLRYSTELIFGKCSADEVLKRLPFNNPLSESFCDKLFQSLSMSIYSGYSINELQNLKNKLNEDWFKDPYKKNGSISIFNLLIHFSKQTLTEIENEPFINYEHLLRWRNLSFYLGEDLFTTSYLAYMDIRSQRKRDLFAWRPVIFSNNLRLKGLLNQGMAENHFHLKGSAPVFDLSWISLMNNIVGRQKEFKSLKKGTSQIGEASYSFEGNYSDIEILTYKAAFIRQYLYKFIHNIQAQEFESKLIKCLKYESNASDSFAFILDLQKIGYEVTTLKEIYGYKFGFKDAKIAADYAIPKNIHSDNQKGAFLMVGERQFLHDCFCKIYSGNSDFKKYHDLFYAYLLIKNKMRGELIQVNNKVGFGNFLKYQDRKEEFIQEGTIYEAAFMKMAVVDSLKSQTIKSFETRIAPKNNAVSLFKSLSTIEKTLFGDIINFNVLPSIDIFLKKKKDITLVRQTHHFHVLHFIKEPEKEYKKSIEFDIVNSVNPRHFKLREKVRLQAKAIVTLREGANKLSESIKGIDAASSEFDTRPEVFAQAFRYLKDHKLKGGSNNIRENIKEKKLYATYHAGEDFYDIIDGLRCIDEAILYLNLKQGDRIGHGIALGVDAKDYFNLKGKKIMIPAEILLDNVVWLLAKIRKFGININPHEVYRLEKIFDSLSGEIYFQHSREVTPNFTHNAFYDAWKLRGDDPMLYLNRYEEDIESIPNMTYWERCRINYHYPRNNNIRNNTKIKFLYHEYHFNPDVKRRGKKIKQFAITEDYIQLVTTVQNYYMEAIKNLNIGIECNPTSNYLIGTFNQYVNHPIIRFYNLGLESDSKIIKNCPQLFVSINTDDQGIFSTSLENEFALMAIALEKEKDDNGNAKYNQAMIYQWLDNIRKMGIEQSFGFK